jgi:hypothetical protein
VHRPFKSEIVSLSKDPSELQARYKAVEASIRSWLGEMGVSSQVTDLMMSTPSSKIRILSRQELEDFGLGAANVMEEEMKRERSVVGCPESVARRIVELEAKSDEFFRKLEELRISGWRDDAFAVAFMLKNDAEIAAEQKKCSR